jgi:hypothetical protein
VQDTYRLYQRSNGIFYAENVNTNKQATLKTRDPAAAARLLAGMNQAAEQPALNVAMAKVYLGAKSPLFCSRTWGDLMMAMAAGYSAATLIRYEKFMKSAPVQSLNRLPLVHTDSGHFLAVLFHPRAGVSTNVWLRITHNRALDLGWILTPVMPKKAWPDIEYKEKRAITIEEHHRVVASERIDDYRAYFQVLWETGGSQTDIANMHRDQVDPTGTYLSFKRKKVKSKKRRKNLLAGKVSFFIGQRLRQLLEILPPEGFLFPRLRLLSEDERASHFKKVCKRVAVEGVNRRREPIQVERSIMHNSQPFVRRNTGRRVT